MKDVFQEGINESLKSANEHYKTAIWLSENINYGFANSHLILAAEELAKACGIKLKSMDAITDEEYENFFRSHPHKHEALSPFLSIFKIVDFVGTIIHGPLSRMAKRMNNRKGESKKPVLDRSFLKEAGHQVTNNINWTFDLEPWCKQAEKKRKDGFYVDRSANKSSGWKAPSDINKEAYLESLTIVERLLKDLPGFCMGDDD